MPWALSVLFPNFSLQWGQGSPITLRCSNDGPQPHSGPIPLPFPALPWASMSSVSLLRPWLSFPHQSLFSLQVCRPPASLLQVYLFGANLSHLPNRVPNVQSLLPQHPPGAWPLSCLSLYQPGLATGPNFPAGNLGYSEPEGSKLQGWKVPLCHPSIEQMFFYLFLPGT